MNVYSPAGREATLPGVSLGQWRRERGLLWWEVSLGDATLTLSTRVGGESAPPYDTLNLGLHVGDAPPTVLANRRALWDALPFGPAEPVIAEQVHGTKVVTVDAGDGGRGWTTRESSVPGTDALVTRAAGVPLAILVADCAPVAIVAPGRALGVAHAGWRGLAGGVIEATLGAMAEAGGAEPADCHAVLGPCIRGCCYEVGEEVWRHFPAACLASSERSGARRLDLMAAVAHRLREAGLRADRIHPLGLCTACHPELFFSHRRATLAGLATTGRMALFAQRRG